MERAAFLRNVRQRLGRREGPPPAPPRWRPPEALFFPDPGDRAEVFTEQSTAQGAVTAVVPSREAAWAQIRSLAEDRGWDRIVADPALRGPALGLPWIGAAAAANLGLCEADYALAETGTVVLLPGDDRRRDTSLLPAAVGFLVPRSRILSRLTELLGELGDRGRDLPACVNLISGPSRTADIELDLCIGVHGPGEVHVWVIADE